MSASDRIHRARNTREAAGRAYLLALHASIAAGEPLHELARDHMAWDRAASQVIEVCGTVGVDAPMVLTA